MASAGLPVFMGEVPEYEVRNGRMHVTLADFEIVMPICVFLQGAARAERAIAEWQIAEAAKGKPTIIPLKRRKRRKRPHAASS
jgi:hypothetical protein